MKIRDKLTDESVAGLLETLDRHIRRYENLADSMMGSGNAAVISMYKAEALAVSLAKQAVEDWLNEEEQNA